MSPGWGVVRPAVTSRTALGVEHARTTRCQARVLYRASWRLRWTPVREQSLEVVVRARLPDNRSMPAQGGSPRAAQLEADLRAVATSLIALLERTPPERWTHIPAASVWSVGKDAAHVAEAAVYHQWIVRLTIGERVSSRRPAIERQGLTTSMPAHEVIDLIRQRTEEGATLIASLSDEQLSLPTRPPRARQQALADTIDLVLIGHYDTHRRDIERKLGGGT